MSAPAIIRRNAPRFGGDAARMLPQGRLAGPMPWVMAIMIALTVVAAAAALALSNVADNARSEIDGGVTVQVVEGAPAERQRQAETVVAALMNRDDVAQVRRVPDDELAELLEPWLGDAGVADPDGSIPTPALVDVQLRGEVTPQRLEDLRGALAAVAPSARVDAQSGWLGPVFDAIAALQWLAIGLMVLLAATSAAAVWLAARSALGANADTIETIHHLGATDSQIARIFQRSIGMDAAIGAAAGLALGLLAVLLLGSRFAQLGSGMVNGGGFAVLDWIAIACVPLAGVGLAVLTARQTVITALRRML